MDKKDNWYRTFKKRILIDLMIFGENVSSGEFIKRDTPPYEGYLMAVKMAKFTAKVRAVVRVLRFIVILIIFALIITLFIIIME